MSDHQYDVVVIGAGPAGYVAAIRCAQLGFKTACIDDWRNAAGKASLGGTCLNVGCIPSKALLDSSHYYHSLQQEAAEHGIRIDSSRIDVVAMQKRKDKVVRTLTGGIQGLFKQNGITQLAGTARLTADRGITVTPPGDSAEGSYGVTAANIILATGSEPAELAVAPVDGRNIVDSSGALALDQVPARLGIIGAGVIGLELGSVWRRLGAEIVMLEAMDTFLPAVDRDQAREALAVFQKQGLDIRVGARVTGTDRHADGVTMTYEDAEGAQQQLGADKLVVAVGRRARTRGLGVSEAGLELDDHGFIEVDEQCRTNIAGVYAVGDVVRGPMLAHKGSEEGVAVAERIAGQAGGVDYGVIPWVIYTWPEIAWVGKHEAQLKAEGIDYRSGVFPFTASGRARALGDTRGSVKILAEAGTDRILGVHIFGPQASELIAEAVTAMAFDASSEDLARTVHAHPTLAEALHEAALAVDQRAIHY